jgi:hypothetical protein
MTKIDSKNSLSPLRHFTEHLVDVFEKLPRENDLDHESSGLSIRWLNSIPGIQPATIQSHHDTLSSVNEREQRALKTNLLARTRESSVLWTKS